MWRRTTLILMFVRLYFALSPSYLHPDENFQGPEVIAGQIFGYPVRHTWEFTSDNPIRSVFPLWPVYGLPMLLLRWLWTGSKGGPDGEAAGEIPPIKVFWALRILMFLAGFVLLDWAIHELVPSTRRRRRDVATLMVASSYVTWTYQTHTFSNAVETLVVVWCLVLIQRIAATNPPHSALLASMILGILCVFGVFNRITFPAFLILPGLRLIPYYWKSPFSLLMLLLSACFTAFIAVAVDTAFFSPHDISWSDLLRSPIITPLNNLTYNSKTENLALHGLHPRYQHILINLPQMLGPAIALVPAHTYPSPHLSSALSGIAILSFIRHQEARFLLPAVPLILTSMRLPQSLVARRIWVAIWVIFNIGMGFLMGIHHQGGVIPAQVFLSTQPDATNAFWWKTYTPPIWLLNGKSETLETRDLMGMPGSELLDQISQLATCDVLSDRRNNEYLREKDGTYLVAPLSAKFLDSYLNNKGHEGLRFREVWRHLNHLNLDDLEWAEDGVFNTLKRVVGRRGLAVWRVTKSCPDGKGGWKTGR